MVEETKGGVSEGTKRCIEETKEGGKKMTGGVLRNESRG
jgi:hypothetical protein